MPRDRTNYGDSNTSDQSIGTKISAGGPTDDQARQNVINETANQDARPDDEHPSPRSGS